MKKNAAAYGFLFLLPLFVLSQTQELDSLQKLAQSATGEKQIDLYIQIASRAATVHADTAMFFVKKASALAEQTGRRADKMLTVFMTGRVLSLKGNYALSMKYFNESLEMAQQEKHDSITACSLHGLGNSLWQLGKHAEALEKHFGALRLREKIKDTRGIAVSKTNIGMVYQSQNKWSLAETYVLDALALFKEMDDPALQLLTMHTLANIYGPQGKIKEAFDLDEKGIAIAEKTNNELAKSLFYDNMGNCYLFGDPPNYQKAFEYFTKTLLIDSAFSNKKQMSDSYVNLGGVFFEQKKYAEAVPYLQRSILLAEESGYIQGKVKALKMLSTAYRQSGQTDEAFAILQQAMNAKDSLVNASSEARIAEMQTVYETEKKQQRIDLQEAQLSKKNYLLAATIITAILLGLLGVSAWRRFRLKQKTRLQQEIIKQQELATKAVMEAEEDERQRIARDLHDGIGQMMSAAKMNLSAFESNHSFVNGEQQASLEKIIGLVDESCKEIRNVSHNMMPNALLKNNLATAIGDFIDKLDKNGLQVHLYTEGLEQRMDAHLETVFYRVIQECVNNVIKHADATLLDISIIRDKQGISATIEDNGKGFDINGKEQFEGIGLKNIRTRIEYLKGTVEMNSAPGKGMLTALNVPVNSLQSTVYSSQSGKR